MLKLNHDDSAVIDIWFCIKIKKSFIIIWPTKLIVHSSKNDVHISNRLIQKSKTEPSKKLDALTFCTFCTMMNVYYLSVVMESEYKIQIDKCMLVVAVGISYMMNVDYHVDFVPTQLWIACTGVFCQTFLTCNLHVNSS